MLATSQLLLVLDEGKWHLIGHNAIASEVFDLSAHLRNDLCFVCLLVSEAVLFNYYARETIQGHVRLVEVPEENLVHTLILLKL